MIAFIVRRLFISVFVLLAATYVVYVLTCFAGDPLASLSSITNDQTRAARMARRSELLHLDVNPFLRYFIWLKGMLGFVVPGIPGSFGTNNAGQDVGALLVIALDSTMRLVVTAALTAVILGVIVGIVSALRQYSGFDYSITFASFVFFSLPVFWVAVLLKQFGAIQFNTWLRDPVIGLPVSVGSALVVALFWQAVVAGDRRRRLLVFGVVFVATVAVLQYLSLVRWFANPALGVGMVALGGVVAGLAATAVTTGLARRNVLYCALLTAALGVVAYFATGPVLINPTWWHILALIGITAVVCTGLGWLMGGLDRGATIRVSLLTGYLTGALIFVDHVLRAVPGYLRMVNGRLIFTVGSETPNFLGRDHFWLAYLDNQTHIILPTITLILISFAQYTRYTRSSMLEVLNQDYIRTARAKGLTERTVVMRHAFRNALIPVTTLMAYDFAAIFGGAIITETVFAWSGMGRLFITALGDVNPDPVMAFFLVTGGAVVIFNMIADIVYAYLDPRIRLS